MRNRFVAEHRGGPLSLSQHRQLMEWAIACAEHVLSLGGDRPDERLTKVLVVAKKWETGSVKTGAAMKASLAAHGVAQGGTDPVKTAIARATGQAVATAHMADHSMGAALYGQRAVHLSGGDAEVERQWQLAQLPAEVRELIETELATKARHFRIQ